MISQYEALRRKNIEDNKRVLAELGLLNPYKKLQVVHHAQPKAACKKRRTSAPTATFRYCNKEDVLPAKRRASARLQGIAPEVYDPLTDDDEDDDEDGALLRTTYIPKDNSYGQIPGIAVGTTWETRMQCSRDGIHRPCVAGIHGNTEEGAYSIALSGGYEDNVDLGTCFTYTGEGGRDLKGTKANPKNLRTAPQSKNQTLTRGNLALSKNVKTGNPVRVIRGFKLPTLFAPEQGYRYDGLYSVEKAWYATGASGFGVWKFALKRLCNQAPPPWEIKQEQESECNNKPSLDEEPGDIDSGLGSEKDA